LIIADEPTSALDGGAETSDGNIGAGQSALDAAVILVGHDMGLMAQLSTV
jgi:ABC-type dipeptide/oligopeptide/nickel transport system ATPase component